MNDRELLELAAKAAGLELTKEKIGDDEFFTRKVGYGSYSNVWNPLTDDGDALRLAVQLEMDVCSNVVGQAQANDCWEFHSENNGDKRVATRRAIVRAAAEIGKAK